MCTVFLLGKAHCDYVAPLYMNRWSIVFFLTYRVHSLESFIFIDLRKTLLFRWEFRYFRTSCYADMNVLFFHCVENIAISNILLNETSLCALKTFRCYGCYFYASSFMANKYLFVNLPFVLDSFGRIQWRYMIKLREYMTIGHRASWIWRHTGYWLSCKRVTYRLSHIPARWMKWINVELPQSKMLMKLIHLKLRGRNLWIPLHLYALNMRLGNLCGVRTPTTCAVERRLANSTSKATLIKLKYLITLPL